MILSGYIFYYVAALVGISIGYHRYFTHRTFKTTAIVEYLMLFLGQICGGRSALTWAAVHRMHHAKSDTEHDPHSPVYKGAWQVLASKWRVDYIPKKYIVDLIRNPRVVWFHKHGQIVHIAYAVSVFVVAGISGFVSLVFMPFVLSWIGFGALNYFAHRHGRPENVLLLNLIAPGEGWHEVHHQRPGAARLHKYDIAGAIIERFFTTTKSSS